MIEGLIIGGALGLAGGTFLGAAVTSKIHIYAQRAISVVENLVTAVTHHTAAVKAAAPAAGLTSSL